VNSAAAPSYGIYRDLLNRWIAELPEGERAKVCMRFRKGDTLHYQATLAELAIHAALVRHGFNVAALVRHGFNVQIHPACSQSKRKPDFLAQATNGDAKSFIEVTTFTPSTAHVFQSKRDAQIYNALDKVALRPGWRLGLYIARLQE
jgi:hypothetical protein